MEEATKTVAVRPHRPLDAPTVERLSIAFPKLTLAKEAFLPGAWIVIGIFTPQVAMDLEADIGAQFPDFEIREQPARAST